MVWPTVPSAQGPPLTRVSPFERVRVELELMAVAFQSMSSTKVVQPRGCL